MLPGKSGRRVYLSIDVFLPADVLFCQQPSVDHSRSSARRVDVPHAPFLRRFPKGGRFVFTFITAPLSGGSLTRVWRAARGFLRCVSGAGGRTCQRYRLAQQEVGIVFAQRTWRVVLAERTPPMRAAAKRRSRAELGCGVGPRRGVYGALARRLIAERRD